VKVTGGVLSGEVDYVLGEQGLAVPLGCHPGVGVSGLTLGGGLGWLLGKYGTTADNVVSMDLITADGRELHVTEGENEDLFWALRGGGGNFGIVTGFEYDVHHLEKIVGGFLVYRLEDMGEFLRHYKNFMSNASDEVTVEISIVPGGTPLMVATVCFTGDLQEAKRQLASIRQFGSPLYDGIRETNYTQLTQISPELNRIVEALPKSSTVKREGDGYYNHWVGLSINQWTDPAIETFTDCVSRAPSGWSIGIGHYMHGAATRVNPDSTPLLRSEGSSSFFFNMGWRNSRDTDMAMSWVDQSAEAMKPFLRNGTYINYLSSNSAKAVANTYAENYSRLQNLKSKYDPDNLFHLNRNVRPLQGETSPG
jgi:FAD/FMN-containing dehydrogenase